MIRRPTERRESNVLKISHVSKTFNPGTVNEKQALSDLNLHLEPEDFVTIIG